MNKILNKSFWKNKRVLITGHTGFKGSWLSLVLSEMKVKLYGYSLKPEWKNQIYHACNVEKLFKKSIYQDINDYKKLKNFIKKIRPQIVFHLAAQPLVINSYKNTLETFNTNIIGTANLCEALKSQKDLRSLVIITSDKCYDNSNRQNKFFKENDKLGGHDPYSASKAASEIIVSSYKNSFYKFSKINSATVRAGNIIGGGDFSKNRIFPDIIYSLKNKKKLLIRNPQSVRPWQHVLEPIAGYIMLAENLYYDRKKIFSGAWNFGPKKNLNKSVLDIIKTLNKFQKINYIISKKKPTVYESSFLGLNVNKSIKKLKWKPKLSFESTIKWTVEWYLSNDKLDTSLKQIKKFFKFY